MRPILLGARQYNAGDPLPSNNSLAETWISNGAARWEDEIEEKATAVKAHSVTAMPGMEGISTTGNKEDLVGRITETPEREKQPVRKRQKK